MNRIPENEWKWFGLAAHFICGRWCRFHMATQIGQFVVSSVGMYVHPRHSQGSERKEAEWLRENPEGEDIGCDRKAETMVFRATDCICTCGCGMPMLDFERGEITVRGYKTIADATKGHMEMCNEVAAWEDNQ